MEDDFSSEQNGDFPPKSTCEQKNLLHNNEISDSKCDT